MSEKKNMNAKQKKFLEDCKYYDKMVEKYKGTNICYGGRDPRLFIRSSDELK